MEFLKRSQLRDEYREHVVSKKDIQDKYLNLVSEILNKIAIDVGITYVCVSADMFLDPRPEEDDKYIKEQVYPILYNRDMLSADHFQKWMHEKGYDKRAIVPDDQFDHMTEKDKKDWESKCQVAQESIQKMYADLPEEDKKDKSKAIAALNEKLKDNPIKL